MKNERKSTSLFLQIFAVAVLLFLAAPNLLAQSTTSSSGGASSGSGISSNGSVSSNSFNLNFRNNPATNYNPPPCDFLDGFYNNVGMSTSNQSNNPGTLPSQTAQGLDTAVAARFGLFRQTGPPALFPSQVNWVIDNTCGIKDTIRKNVRILATTGGYSDDELGSPTHFINIMAFVMNQSFFESSFTSDPDNLGAIIDPNMGINIPFAFDCTPPPQGTLPTAGCVSITDGNALNITGSPQVGFGLNARNVTTAPQPQPMGPAQPDPVVGAGNGNDMQDIVSNFEAYPAPKQRLPNGVFAVIPCGSLNNSNNNPAMVWEVANNTTTAPAGLQNIKQFPDPVCFPVTSIATPTLRQDWRFATNRNAIDGSDNNVVTGSGLAGTIGFNSPYGYFCDDLLGMWINSYFWLTQDPAVNGPCTKIYNQLGAMTGFTTDGTPVVKTGNQLDVTLEAAGCAAEGQLDLGGADGGAVWLICPAIADPTNGAISLDAFLDQVHFSNGVPVDPGFTINFFCLQFFGQFCSTLTSSQSSLAQSNGAAAQSSAASAPAAVTTSTSTSN